MLQLVNLIINFVWNLHLLKKDNFRWTCLCRRRQLFGIAFFKIWITSMRNLLDSIEDNFISFVRLKQPLCRNFNWKAFLRFVAVLFQHPWWHLHLIFSNFLDGTLKSIKVISEICIKFNSNFCTQKMSSIDTRKTSFSIPLSRSTHFICNNFQAARINKKQSH